MRGDGRRARNGLTPERVGADEADGELHPFSWRS